MKKIIILSILFLCFYFSFGNFTNAAVKIDFDTFQNIDSGLPNFINELYKFAVIIGGIFAFLMIVWGGIQYQFAGASPQREGEAKDIILNALWGLLLLLGAYIILRTVNPVLVELNDPSEELGNVFVERCTKDTLTKNFSDGTKVEPRLCGLGESPINPDTGKCQCYVDEVWLETYNAAFEDQQEGTENPDFNCETQQSLKGSSAASTIMTIGKKFKNLTYTQDIDKRTRPDLGFADCSGFAHYLYKCVMGANLQNSLGLETQQLPPELERFSANDPKKEEKAEIGDVIGLSKFCKNGQSGHVMLVAEKQNGKVTKILHVTNMKTKGGPFLVQADDKRLGKYRECGYTIHIKR